MIRNIKNLFLHYRFFYLKLKKPPTLILLERLEQANKTRMILLYIISLTAVGVSSQTSCDYGHFTDYGTPSGECMFDCEYNDNINFVTVSSLSFDFIRSQCDGDYICKYFSRF